MKTRQAFYLHTTKLTRIARRLCREILRPWHAARHPYMPINSAAIKAECESSPVLFLGPSRSHTQAECPGWGTGSWGTWFFTVPCPVLVQAQHGCPKPPRAHWC
jgi:hypothetical protein